jgi:hypothetical protein
MEGRELVSGQLRAPPRDASLTCEFADLETVPVQMNAVASPDA